MAGACLRVGRDFNRVRDWGTLRVFRGPALRAGFSQTTGFRLVYVFVVLDISTRPARALERDRAPDRRVDRAAVPDVRDPGDDSYPFVIHDRDAIYSGAVERTLKSMHLRVLTTPVRAHKPMRIANA